VTATGIFAGREEIERQQSSQIADAEHQGTDAPRAVLCRPQSAAGGAIISQAAF
jgi:hypothetical protein